MSTQSKRTNVMAVWPPLMTLALVVLGAGVLAVLLTAMVNTFLIAGVNAWSMLGAPFDPHYRLFMLVPDALIKHWSGFFAAWDACRGSLMLSLFLLAVWRFSPLVTLAKPAQVLFVEQVKALWEDRVACFQETANWFSMSLLMAFNGLMMSNDCIPQTAITLLFAYLALLVSLLLFRVIEGLWQVTGLVQWIRSEHETHSPR